MKLDLDNGIFEHLKSSIQKIKVSKSTLQLPTSNFKSPGFTLIEILVAISIMLVVFGFIFSSATSIQKRSRDQQRTTDLQNIQSALAAFYADQQYYPLGYSQSATPRFEVMFDNNLTSSSGNPTAPSSAKTYLAKIPTDPKWPAGCTSVDCDNGWHYCYESYSSITAGNNNTQNSCNNTTTSCQYYKLMAVFEKSGLTEFSSQNLFCGGGHHFNVLFDPYKSGIL